MRRILICTGVLGGGTALVFALAGLTATLFPQGTLVQANPWRGGVMMDGWGGGFQPPVNAIQVAPAIRAPSVDISVAAP
jgi:hypothetical protein